MTEMKSTLRALFKGYGKILDVVAHSNLRMRGQAFVSFESKEVAAKALKEVKNFPLYAKPMVRYFIATTPSFLTHLTPSFVLHSPRSTANIICKITVRRSGKSSGRASL